MSKDIYATGYIRISSGVQTYYFQSNILPYAIMLSKDLLRKPMK